MSIITEGYDTVLTYNPFGFRPTFFVSPEAMPGSILGSFFGETIGQLLGR
jgi:hypothetical protein